MWCVEAYRDKKNIFSSDDVRNGPVGWKEAPLTDLETILFDFPTIIKGEDAVFRAVLCGATAYNILVEAMMPIGGNFTPHCLWLMAREPRTTNTTIMLISLLGGVGAFQKLMVKSNGFEYYDTPVDNWKTGRPNGSFFCGLRRLK